MSDSTQRPQPTPPAPPANEHEKPIQPGTDMSVGHGKYLDDPAAQDDAWANAVTLEGDPHPDSGS